MKKLFFASFFFLSCLPTVKNLANSKSEDFKNTISLNSSESLTIGEYFAQELGQEASSSLLSTVSNFQSLSSDNFQGVVAELFNILKTHFNAWKIKFHIINKISINSEDTWVPIYGSFMKGNDLHVFLLYNGSTDDFFVGPLTESADKSEFYKSQPLKFIGSKNLAVFIYENIEVKPDKLYLYKGDEQILKIAVSTNNLSGIKDKYKILDL
jgi:hypothetical protein